MSAYRALNGGRTWWAHFEFTRLFGAGRRVSGFVQVAQHLPRTGRIALFERGHGQQRFAPGQGFDTGSKGNLAIGTTFGAIGSISAAKCVRLLSYLWLSLRSPHWNADAATVRQLATHTAGLTTFDSPASDSLRIA